jgi:hypothetical protein
MTYKNSQGIDNYVYGTVLGNTLYFRGRDVNNNWIDQKITDWGPTYYIESSKSNDATGLFNVPLKKYEFGSISESKKWLNDMKESKIKVHGEISPEILFFAELPRKNPIVPSSIKILYYDIETTVVPGQSIDELVDDYEGGPWSQEDVEELISILENRLNELMTDLFHIPNEVVDKKLFIAHLRRFFFLVACICAGEEYTKNEMRALINEMMDNGVFDDDFTVILDTRSKFSLCLSSIQNLVKKYGLNELYEFCSRSFNKEKFESVVTVFYAYGIVHATDKHPYFLNVLPIENPYHCCSCDLLDSIMNSSDFFRCCLNFSQKYCESYFEDEQEYAIDVKRLKEKAAVALAMHYNRIPCRNLFI